MLAIRMQRRGRKGLAQYRVVVQDSRYTPTSGRVVASLGHHDPHTKQTTIDTEKAGFYLEHGAQPSPRVAKLLQDQGVKLPSWVKLQDSKNRAIKNQDKLRKNQPKEEEAPEEAPADTAEEATEAPEEEATEAAAETEEK